MNNTAAVLSISLLFILTLTTLPLKAQDSDEDPDPRHRISWSGLEFRSIGPALTSGRISDFAVNPSNTDEFYVATSSGGVWKTTNKGIDFTPIFDKEGSYSIGHVAIDPNNHNVVWVGTGENNNQRSVSYGDGLYKSVDGGKSWKHVGLKNSEHIGMIEIDPRDSDVVYVAAYGPLWSAGGDRGLYKTTDGGETWESILTISEHTGINEVHLDPRNPDVIYAAAHQRRRHVFTLIDGGPESALYKSTDGGKNWRKIMTGMPGGHIGRIGLDISPANPDILYAIVEAQEDKGGFYRSTDRGESWERRNSYTSRGNYYQEVFADPVDPDRVYSMDVFTQVSTDGGKTFSNLGEQNKHIDNHALWIDPDNPEYLLAGCDGGIYESYDRGKTWRFFPNLPVTQFYKVAVDNAKPFYNIHGGTQDNFSLAGPSRTISPVGITNDRWMVTLLGDGFETQIDPKNPNIVYPQYQYGNLARFDKQSGETIMIKPRPLQDSLEYTWNWDSPLMISPHNNKRLYFAADYLFRSNDRGNSWEVISDDLTRKIDRNRLEVMGRVWPMDAVAKNASTSEYGNTVSLDESAIQEGLLAVGTDDGLIHISENGGQSWRTISKFPGVPERTYVDDVVFSQHDRNTIYAAFNNHKNGDFKPYLLKSTDLGRSWRSVASNLPERGSIYALAEDHLNSNLLFVGTEFSLFVSLNGGRSWKKLDNGLPTIAVRDVVIQKRENDLVLGTFGRGFYVLDNYTPLRTMTEQTVEKEAQLFSVKDAYQFIPYSRIGASKTISWLGEKGFQGETWYLGENLGPEAHFTYFLKETIQTLEEQRQEEEKEKFEKGEPVYYPSYDRLKKEMEEKPPYLLFTIRNMNNEVVREVKAPATKGLHRVSWDLRYPDITEVDPGDSDLSKTAEEGILALPGRYTVQMAKSVNGKVTVLSEPMPFTVKRLDNRTLPTDDPEATTAFHRKLTNLSRALNGARQTYNQLEEKANYYRAAAKTINDPDVDSLHANIDRLEDKLDRIRTELYGDRVASRLDMDQKPSISDRVNSAVGSVINSTTDPTETSNRVSKIAAERLKPLINQLKSIINTDVARIEQQLDQLGAPWTPGRLPDLEDF